jgi:hypothetical protein
LDSFISAAWRFALLEFVVRNRRRDYCGKLKAQLVDVPNTTAHHEGHVSCSTFGAVHVAVALFLATIMLSELYLANAVRKLARALRSPEEVEPIERPLDKNSFSKSSMRSDEV